MEIANSGYVSHCKKPCRDKAQEFFINVATIVNPHLKLNLTVLG